MNQEKLTEMITNKDIFEYFLSQKDNKPNLDKIKRTITTLPVGGIMTLVWASSLTNENNKDLMIKRRFIGVKKIKEDKYGFLHYIPDVKISKVLIEDVCHHLGYKRIYRPFSKKLEVNYTQILGIVENIDYFLDKFMKYDYPETIFLTLDWSIADKVSEALNRPFKISYIQQEIYRILEDYQTITTKKERLKHIESDYNDFKEKVEKFKKDGAESKITSNAKE